MSKIIICSDLHIGVRGDNGTYQTILDKWFDDFLIPSISKENIEHLFILGDIFENRNSINSKSKNLAIRKFDELVEKYPDLKIIMLVGNHDIYYKTTRSVFSPKIFENRYKNLEIINELTIKEIDNRKFLFAPWLIDGEEVDKMFKMKADVCFGHFEISDFYLVKGVLETKGINPGKFRKLYRKTFSGHYHIRQEEKGIIYVGNPFQMNWNDFLDDKGLYVLDTKTLNHKFIKNEISPIYEKIHYSRLKLKTQDLNNIHNNFIQLIIDEPCDDKTKTKLFDIIENKEPLTFDVNDLDLSISDMDGEIVSEVTKPLEYMNEYLQKCQLPEDYEYSKLKLTKMINEVYNKVSR